MASCLAIPSKHLLSRLICLMKLQVTANFHVALMRVKIIWKLTHKTQDSVLRDVVRPIYLGRRSSLAHNSAHNERLLMRLPQALAVSP